MTGDGGRLFDTAPRQSAGKVRRGLDAEVKARRGQGVDVAADAVALLRTLADEIDRWARWVATAPQARGYDRVVLAQLVAQYDATRAVTLPSTDPADAVDELLQRLYAEESDAERSGPAL